MENTKIKDINVIAGSITVPQGFSATGDHIGIKKKRKDLTLIKSDVPATAAGVFTLNSVKAPPVLWNQQKIINNINGIVINSGVANACTGETGRKNTELMAQIYAECLNVSKESILVASTGVIGVQLPMEVISQGIKNLFPKMDNAEKSSRKAAEGIMTTDKFPKEIAIETEINGKTVRFGAIAKGSGMIHPNMATMLAFVTTDADINRKLLQKCLKECVDDSFNMISVDGDTSTNDMVIALANGQAGNSPIETEDRDYNKFKKALEYVTLYLAKQIIMDGEGVTKFLEVKVQGASTKEDARKIAKSIINSNLVKTAMFGSDANWGRIVCAAGYSGANFDHSRADVEFSSAAGAISPLISGEPVIFDEDLALNVLKEREIQILFALKDGKEEATAWGCDLTYDYVKINGEYRT
ncbi:MAG TPA: bifunctional ornithine acetyltransferase/N-acetylglutamate synthase [Candidatus Gastranaerophilales bacterium]|nr:bifunctional ornithine acetyltransferase/N-acetylglutamate synthase [Candidatus Gastranaerophilales bacterium]